MDNKTITVSIKNIYGRDVVYPICDDAKSFAQLAGTKTLTMDAIGHIKNLGYTVSVKQTEL